MRIQKTFTSGKMAATLVLILHVMCPTFVASRVNEFEYIGRKPILPSQGKVWPQPQHHLTGERYWILDENNFHFRSLDSPCSIVREAFLRYINLMFHGVRKLRRPVIDNQNVFLGDSNFAGKLQMASVFQTGACEETPYLNMNERYDLKIDDKGSNITATSVWGILRGLETFSQLAFRDPLTGNLIVRQNEISDYPRFAHRGILVDTARHYIPKHILMENLDAMSYNKFNVFHWHIVDDQSFPFKSKVFPELSNKGAYNSITHVYTVDDVNEIVDYARQRGIRVIPEFDTPAHTFSWGNGAPRIMTECYTTDGTVVPNWYGPLNPILETTYAFLKDLFREITQLFPDEYIHVGGDEVTFNCWISNPLITSFMELVNFGNDYRKLFNYYFAELFKTITSVSKTKRNFMVWQDVFDRGTVLDKSTVIQVWQKNATKVLKAVTMDGYRVVLSSPWYLSQVLASSDWRRFYEVEPLSFMGTDDQKELVIGGEACMWSEYVDGVNLMPRMWPRAAAVAERLWSSRLLTNANLAAPKLEEQRCRMLVRGIDVEPQLGPGYCEADFLV